MDYLGKISLKGKTALVAGGGRGMGEASAAALAQAGAKVLVVDYNQARAVDVARRIVKEGGDAVALQADLRERADIEAVVSEAVEKHNGIDVLVNVAGGMSKYPYGPTKDWSDEAWDGVVNLNLRYVFLISRAVLKVMEGQRRGGSIVNIASIAGLRVSPGMAAYGAAKAGLIQLTQTLAAEHGKDGIRVNCIAPGVIRTPIVAESLNPERFKGLPLGRFGEADEVGAIVLFLASPMSSYVTGATIVADGGMTLSAP
jgi:NAD(P)-dependent dehydrogenase (short-subunit alcohol dehydrogenase family)